ncbi:DNA mismatch endonuclease Vsr [Nocardia cyriacigeorgica]|nr:very short patch repair endonuclease [Nocardia cyriacigeorgica]MBF6397903.1 DNA mismatch endonuclease Vsr [Nocardia cyriacigeorgica]MBF6402440.1 DNA mismatch endonuclease Vsr [Nocardia cyriacigeorgica]
MKGTPEQRSATMRAVRSTNTGPEMAVRRFLHARGFRYRLHDKRLPGRPDLVFPTRRIAVFVHGCFWHQHPGCQAAARPASNAEYWTRKLDGNVARDARHLQELDAQHWTVKIIWECQTRDDTALAALAAEIASTPPTRPRRPR